MKFDFETFAKYWGLLWNALYALFAKLGIDFMYKVNSDTNEKDEEWYKSRGL